MTSLLLAVVLIEGSVCASVPNGDFETRPNSVWLTDDGESVSGDAPVIGRGLQNNHFGHLGDRDGRGGEGRTRSRLYQSFDCGPAEGDCEVSFRYKTGHASETVYVALSGSRPRRSWRIPNTGGLWSGPGRVFCSFSDSVTLEFGLVGASDHKVAAYLSVDDVRGRSVSRGTQTLVPLSAALTDSMLRGFGDAGSVVPVPFDVLSERRPRPVSLVIASLVFLGLVILFWRMSRSWRSGN